MEYMSPQEASKKWNICLRRVQRFCSEDRIPGAIKMGRQWLIPITAQKPEDARKKATRSSYDTDYRFPIFVYSDCFVARSDLSADETLLLNAQISLLKNDYNQCIADCRKLTADDYPVHIKFGAYCTILYASIVLGLYSEVVQCIDMLDSISKQFPDNEDYKLLIYALKLQYTFDCESVKYINSQKLSPDALILYQLINIETLIFNKYSDSDVVEALCCSICYQLKLKGISPAVMIVCGVMALFYQRNGDAEKMNFCIDEVCRIGHDEGFLKLLTKNSSLATAEYRQALQKYGNDFADKIQLLHQQNVLGFQIIYGAIRNEPFFKNCTPEENEIMLLLSYDFSNKTIAEIKNITLKKLSKIIVSLRNRYNIKTRNELVKFTKRMYNNKKI